MTRMLNLILFELKKILNNKKAFLFLMVLNITPIIASIVLLLVYLTCKGLGLGEIQFTGMKTIIQNLFTGHFTLFAYIAPFFLALIVGDSFSTEFGRGYMKMLLLTPVKRWQVVTAKTISIITYLLIAVLLGGLILQTDLLVARAVTQPTGILPPSLQAKALDSSLSMVSFSSATQLLILTFVSNLMLIGFFIFLSMFFESAILMSFSSLGIIMGIQVFYLSTTVLSTFFAGFKDGSSLKILITIFDFLAKHCCFTRHYTDLFTWKVIQDILDGKSSLLSTNIATSLGYCFLWSVIFYGIATFVFSRKQVLH